MANASRSRYHDEVDLRFAQFFSATAIEAAIRESESNACVPVPKSRSEDEDNIVEEDDDGT